MQEPALPTSAVFELTYRCNHQCKFCSCPWFAPDSTYPMGQELSIEQWQEATDILLSKGITHFSISGGEVLLKEGFDRLLRHIRRASTARGLNSPIVLISNGRAMRTEYLQLFKELNVHLSMSLPGLKTFQYHTGIDNADGVLHWFQEANAFGLSTTVNVTVTQKNIHELFETIALGLINGADSLLLNRFLPGGRGLAHLDSLKLTQQQVNQMLDTAEEVLGHAKRYGSVGTEIPRCAISDPQKYKHIHFGYQCAAAKGFFVIDPAGQIRCCNHSPHIVGHIFDTPMIGDTDYWNTFAHRDYTPAPCRNCASQPECDCGCREVANILHHRPNAVDSSILDPNNIRQNP